MKKKIIIALTIVLCFSIMVIKKASAEEIETFTISIEWQGTEVQSEGLVEEIYFNRFLNVQEVNSILDNVEFGNFNEFYDVYIVFSDESMSNGVSILKDKELNYYLINITINNEVRFIFTSNNEDTSIYGWFDIYGFNYYYSPNCENYSFNYLPHFELNNQNHILKNLISTTPFKYVPSYNDGMADGWQAGYDEGYDYGYDDGEHDGFNDGASEGYQDGYEVGYDEGIKKGEEVNANLGDMFLNILDSPRQAISNILNFEFLGINLASLVFFLITAILVVVIIKFFI